IKEQIAASETAMKQSRDALAKHAASWGACWLLQGPYPTPTSPDLVTWLSLQKAADNWALAELTASATEAKHAAFLAVLAAERLEAAGKKDEEEGKTAATEAVQAQRKHALWEAKKNLLAAQQAQHASPANGRDAAAKKTAEAEKAVAAAESNCQAPAATNY